MLCLSQDGHEAVAYLAQKQLEAAHKQLWDGQQL
jgi:hypothetical protein